MALGVFLEKKVWGIINITLKAFTHGKKRNKESKQPTNQNKTEAANKSCL